jgi:putative membrane protein
LGRALQEHSRLAKWLGAALLIVWAALAIHPLFRQDWLLENMLVFVSVPLIVRFGPGLKFSDATYLCMFVFFVLHLIGAHYTYAEVPYTHWYASLTGRSFAADFGVERNHYDRVIHLAYGMLMALPALELLAARAPPKGIWRWLLPVLFLSSHSIIYEVIEWFAAVLFGGDLGVAYLGTQGDVWDAQKDMGLAMVGAALGVTFWLVRMRPAKVQ